MIVSPPGVLFSSAISGTLVTKVAVWLESIDHPTTRRENTSNTTQQ
jgi:hypothetical protein